MEAMSIVEQPFTVRKSQPVLVKPETTTSDGFYFLSNLDQLLSVIIPTVYCFKPEDKQICKSVGNVIKQALARVLVLYYPLAGRLTLSSEEKLVVKCTNEGVQFVEAVADCDIDVLGDITIPNPAISEKLVHATLGETDILEMPLLTVQVTRFRCGGFVLGMALSHCMADGFSAMEFVNSWAEIARGASLTVPPNHDRSILECRQPPKVEYNHDAFVEIEDKSNINSLYQEEQVITTKFHLDQEKIERLKKIAMEDGVIKSCTSFTVLAALIWRARTKAFNMKPDQQIKFMIPVDGRSKLDPTPPKGYFGNVVVQACCVCTAGELTKKPLSFAVELVQNTVKLVTDNFVKSAVDYLEVSRAKLRLNAALLVTAWTRLSFNNADFGWGEPTQSGIVRLPDKEVAVFLPTGGYSKRGTTVLLSLPTTVMKNFEDLMNSSFEHNTTS